MRPAGAVILFMMFCANEVSGASATAAISATVIQPLGVSTAAPLQFGAFATLAGGSLTIDGNGSVATSGDVSPSSSGPAGPARFVLSGEPGATYAITLPRQTELGHETEPDRIQISDFTIHSSSPYVFDSSGEAQLSIGATLRIGKAPALGTYHGSFEIMVEYN